MTMFGTTSSSPNIFDHSTWYDYKNNPIWFIYKNEKSKFFSVLRYLSFPPNLGNNGQLASGHGICCMIRAFSCFVVKLKISHPVLKFKAKAKCPLSLSFAFTFAFYDNLRLFLQTLIYNKFCTSTACTFNLVVGSFGGICIFLLVYTHWKSDFIPLIKNHCFCLFGPHPIV